MGKLMDDSTKTMGDFKIIEKSTIVLMTLKVKPAKPAVEEEAK